MSDPRRDVRAMWDARYDRPDYLFGTEPNDFLRAVLDKIPPGPVLCIGEGQGRNAVFLASKGFAVTAMDSSPRGLEKAQELAASQGVALVTEVGDLNDYPIAANHWAAVVSIFVHLPAPLRRSVHQRVAAGLIAGGVFIIEAYQPSQIARGTGGPRDPKLLASLATLRTEFAGLELEIAQELTREVIEGPGHNGISDVVQIVARKA